MIITIDCNSDEITITDTDSKFKPITMECTHPYNVNGILLEIFNILDISGTNIEIIDENNRKTIGEW